MSIEALKEQARRHEQKEQWDKALDLYSQAIDRMPEGEPDIGLFNRAGDLNTRLDRTNQALEMYNRAIDLYLEQELPNNAIAVCKKVIRNVPLDAGSFLRMGQIRSDQGFMVDARANYISYAEKVDQDEALRALEEFADRASDDHEIRLLLAAQMEQLDRKSEAAGQLVAAFHVLNGKGMADEAAALQPKIHELDPNASLTTAPAGAAEVDDLPEFETDFGDFDLGDDAEDEATVGAGAGEFHLDDADDAGEPEDDDSPLPMMSFDDEESAVEPLPTFSMDESAEEEAAPPPTFSMDESAEEEAAPLPTFSMDESDEEEAAPLPTFSMDEGDEEEPEPLPTFSAFEDDEEEAAPLPTFSTDDGDDVESEPLPTFTAYDDDEEEAAPPLPTFSADEDEEEAEPLPTFTAYEEEEVAPLPTFATDVGSQPSGSEVSGALEAAMEEASAGDVPDVSPAVEAVSDVPVAPPPAVESAAAPPAGHEALAESGDFRGAIDALDAEISGSPQDIERRQRRVEYAFRINDGTVLSASYFGLATALEAAGQAVRAKAVYQQAVQADGNNADAAAALARIEGGGAAAPAAAPTSSVASTDDYIDLGSMILGDEDEEKSTRFVVAYEEPTGDEGADFSRMLAQFKAKVSESIDADDVTAHYDLGTAYKEMGLLDEAISEFQQALRASSDHLATYEMLGQTFLEKGENEAAVRSLTRALDAKFEIEDELMGIYYYLAKAHEALGNNDSAIEFYDRVFALDINFADVTERLRALRP